MTAPALDTTEGDSGHYLLSTPFVIRRLRVTSGNTATAIAHSGPAVAPNFVTGVKIAGTPGGGEMVWTPTPGTPTTITLDFEDDTNDTWYVFCFWFDQATGGTS